jgi:hypothetical protein
MGDKSPIDPSNVFRRAVAPSLPRRADPAANVSAIAFADIAGIYVTPAGAKMLGAVSPSSDRHRLEQKAHLAPYLAMRVHIAAVRPIRCEPGESRL